MRLLIRDHVTHKRLRGGAGVSSTRRVLRPPLILPASGLREPQPPDRAGGTRDRGAPVCLAKNVALYRKLADFGALSPLHGGG